MKKLIALLVALMMLGTAAAMADTLTMGTNANFPPYEYHENDAIVGIDAEIAAAIAAKLGMDLDIVDLDFDAIIPAVKTGKVMMGMAGMTVTEDRLKEVSFTETYATGIQVIIVKEGSEITCADDLYAEGANWYVGVQTGTTGDLYVGWDMEDAAEGSSQEREKKYKNGADAVEALKTGKVDCVVIDNEPAKAFVAANADAGLVILESAYIEEEYAIAVAPENTELLDKINAALKELIEDGTVAGIIAKYIPAE
ncbi:MAG: transporter substrate-binding domain-containing protein [Clostridiales bacterium]|nr:transporter substrate-binding domain-containing protein [Clostridiales bacterium]